MDELSDFNNVEIYYQGQYFEQVFHTFQFMFNTICIIEQFLRTSWKLSIKKVVQNVNLAMIHIYLKITKIGDVIPIPNNYQIF